MFDHRSTADNGRTGDTADRLQAAYEAEMRAYRHANAIGDWSGAWRHLERAHIIAQPQFRMHFRSHAAMLKFAFLRCDIREILGQLLRIALVPLGALTGRLPTGNTGRARVSAFAPMPVPDDLRTYVRQDAP
jgi:hypothetical protein